MALATFGVLRIYLLSGNFNKSHCADDHAEKTD